MQLFYDPEVNENATRFALNESESKHIIKVLRKKVGDTIKVTDGEGSIYTGKITDTNAKRCSLDIIATKREPKPRYWLHMAVAPTKLNDRFEWFLEKATEIGVHEITPILCEHSERKIIKVDRYKKVILSAMKQSFQAYLPRFNDLISLNDFLEQPNEGTLFMAHCEDSDRHELKRRVIPDQATTILIGPEGDFSQKEIKLAKAHGYVPVSLGRNRLRTETAAIVACTTVALINNI